LSVLVVQFKFLSLLKKCYYKSALPDQPEKQNDFYNNMQLFILFNFVPTIIH